MDSKQEETKFYKILRNDLTHNNFVYKLGLNVDTVPFNPNGSCKSGGLYYTTADHLAEFFEYGQLIADVENPTDAKTYKDPEGNKFKADRLIITRTTPIYEHKLWLDKEFCITTVQQVGAALRFVKEQTEEICTLAVQQYGYALQYVKKQTEEICKLAVQQNGCALQYVRDKQLRKKLDTFLCAIM